jgi:hypothetical protein
MPRAQQFSIIDAARKRLLEWAEARRIPLVRVEFVVPFVENDFSLGAWLFTTPARALRSTKQTA